MNQLIFVVGREDEGYRSLNGNVHDAFRIPVDSRGLQVSLVYKILLQTCIFEERGAAESSCKSCASTDPTS